ncbi:MAG: 23S rRNA (uracil(1939)-C(5))-methyltransferase RlmD [Bacteroidales bacterium]|nr:23S rRNA (uracil(1939)-C(5))-methyltransferase RlmD [Bacteroidales bacterium]
MGRKQRGEQLILENIEIIDAGAEGNAVARVNDMVIFVPFVVPGDICDIRIVSRKRRFYEGRAIKIHRYSPDRIEPVCSHFGICGGCRWQVMSYAEQLRFKQKQVSDNFSRIGHLEYPEIRQIMPSERTEFYRNKLEYTFSPFRWLTADEMNTNADDRDMDALGFHIPGMFDRIIDIEKCWLQPEPSNEIRLALKQFAKSHGMTFYNIRKFSGDLRNLIIRNSNTGDLMVIMVFGTNDAELINRVMTFLSESFPEITSLFYVVNQKHNDTIGDLEPVLFKGAAFMTEKMEDLQFRIGPLSFFQTNAVQALELYRVAREFAGLNGDEIVYDLYTGTGTIANFVASRAKKVVGIEYVEAAVRDADINSQINNIDNTVFFAGDMVKVLTEEFITGQGHPDVIITDPPRAGMHEKVVKRILEAAPSKIVYVSCNPATQARDLSLMAENYDIKAVQPVDMFPHTHHVENVVLLELKAML